MKEAAAAANVEADATATAGAEVETAATRCLNRVAGDVHAA